MEAAAGRMSLTGHWLPLLLIILQQWLPTRGCSIFHCRSNSLNRCLFLATVSNRILSPTNSWRLADWNKWFAHSLHMIPLTIRGFFNVYPQHHIIYNDTAVFSQNWLSKCFLSVFTETNMRDALWLFFIISQSWVAFQNAEALKINALIPS